MILPGGSSTGHCCPNSAENTDQPADYAAGRADIIDYFRHHSRGNLFSGALPPPCAAASIAALDVLEAEPWIVEHLHRNARHWRQGLQGLGFDTFTSETPIVPVRMPDERTAFAFTRRCRERGVFVVPVVFPAVPQNAPRLRTCVTAGLTDADLDMALDVMAVTGKELLTQHDRSGPGM